MTAPAARKRRGKVAAKRPSEGAIKHAGRRWSAEATRKSNALDLEEGVFTWKDPARIAASLKRSAIASTRRKAEPFRSALSMLTFHINRAGTSFPTGQRKVLEQAKVELRRQFHRL